MQFSPREKQTAASSKTSRQEIKIDVYSHREKEILYITRWKKIDYSDFGQFFVSLCLRMECGDGITEKWRIRSRCLVIFEVKKLPGEDFYFETKQT